MQLGQFAKGSSLTLLRQLFAFFVSIGSSIILARALGPEGRGVLALALLVPAVVTKFTSAGIDTATIYFIGQGTYATDRIASTNLVMGWLLGGISVGVSAIVIVMFRDIFVPGVSAPILFLAIISQPLVLSQTYLANMLLGLQRISIYNALLVLKQVLQLGLVIFLVVLLRWQVKGALIALLAMQFIVFIVTWRLVIREIGTFSIQVDRRYLKNSLSYGLKAQLGNIAAFFNYRLDIFLVNLMKGTVAVGIYGVAVSIGEQIWMLSRAVSLVMFPQLASMKSEDMRRAFTPIVARNVLLLSILGGLGLYISAPWLMSFLYGGEFAGAASALRFLVPGIVVLAASRVLANDIAARGRPLVNSYLGIAILVVNLAFNLILIPRMGINGAALASTISYSTNGLLRLIIYCRLSGNTPLDVILLQKSDIEGYRRLINRSKRRILTRLRE